MPSAKIMKPPLSTTMLGPRCGRAGSMLPNSIQPSTRRPHCVQLPEASKRKVVMLANQNLLLDSPLFAPSLSAPIWCASRSARLAQDRGATRGEWSARSAVPTGALIATYDDPWALSAQPASPALPFEHTFPYDVAEVLGGDMTQKTERKSRRERIDPRLIADRRQAPARRSQPVKAGAAA